MIDQHDHRRIIIGHGDRPEFGNEPPVETAVSNEPSKSSETMFVGGVLTEFVAKVLSPLAESFPLPSDELT